MKKSRVFTLGLVGFLTAVTAFSTLAATSGGGALLRNLSDKNGFSSALQSGQNATENLTPQEQLLAGTLELDPENDPVIYTTDYGLDIKWHMASPLPEDPNDLSTKGVSPTAWAYFEAGGLEWIIIGCSNKSTTLSGVLNLSNILDYYQKAGYYNFSNTTSDIWYYLLNPIDDELENHLNKIHSSYNPQIYASSSNTISQKDVFPDAVATDELETNEVLCLLLGNYANKTFGSNNIYYSSTGVSSNLRTYINDTIYPLVKDLPIEPQPLTTAGSAITTEHLFPLGSTKRASTESFAVENYLDSTTKRNFGAEWWSRSGYASRSDRVYVVDADGDISYFNLVTISRGVRPAFVLKI